MKKSDIHKELRKLNNKIEKNLVTKIVDPRFSAPFDISRKNKGFNFTVKIKVGGYESCVIISFGFRIDVSVVMHTAPFGSVTSNYTLYDGETMPIDTKEYIDTMSNFLFGLIRWAGNMAYANEEYPEMVPSCYNNPDFPFKYQHWSTAYEDMFLHEYSWNNEEEMKYMIDVWNSKEFAKERGEYSAWN